METSYGKGVQIENVEVLHKAIASYLVMTKKALKPKEFRFLRKQLNLTKKNLVTDEDAQIKLCARYEKGECDIPATTNLTLRILCAVELMPNHKREEFLVDLRNILKSENAHRSQIFLRETAGHWDASAIQQ